MGIGRRMRYGTAVAAEGERRSSEMRRVGGEMKREIIRFIRIDVKNTISAQSCNLIVVSSFT